MTFVTAGVRVRSCIHRIEAFIAFACVLGFLVGWLHAARFLHTRLVLQRLAWETRDIPRMAPASNAILLTCLAIVLLPLVIWNPRNAIRLAPPWIVAAAAVFCVLLLHFPRVHPIASLLLASGVGLKVAQAYDRMWPPWRYRLRFMVLSMLIACGVGFVAIRGPSPADDDRVAATDVNAPNVIVLLLDTVRAASMSVYGYSRQTTPRLQEIAAKGVTFEYAVSPSSWTLPSHASLLTGYAPHALAADWRRPLDQRFPTIAEQLQRRGYRTAGFVANNWYASDESGLSRGFDEWFDFDVSLRQLLSTATPVRIPLVSNIRWAKDWRERLRALAKPDFRLRPLPRYPRKRAAHLNDQFLAWQAKEPDAPFFAFFNYFDAHEPYQPPAPFDTRFSRSPSALDHYDGALAYLDHHIGSLVDSLNARRLRRPTLLIVTSDHGELFGENGKYGHGNGVYWRSIHVPLIVSFAGPVPQGLRIDEVVSLVDLPSTIADLLEVDSGAVGGVSLARTWEDSVSSPPLPVVSEFWQTGRQGSAVMVRDLEVAVVSNSLQVILRSGEPSQVFNIRREPRGTMRDSSEIASALQQTLRMSLDSILRLRGPFDAAFSGGVAR